jgi:HK97 family phage prohead protease
METDKRPKPGQIEERQAPDLEVDGPRIRGRIPYGVESRDLGGFREVIERGALNRTKFDDLVVTVDHVGLPLGRYPGTLELEDRDDGLHWSVDPPKSRADIREAIERGDLRGGSWRMVVAKDRWEGEVRHVEEIELLRDVAVVTRPAYEAAAVELRSSEGGEGARTVGAAARLAPTATSNIDHSAGEDRQEEVQKMEEKAGDNTEQRDVEALPAGSLRVEERAGFQPLSSMTETFRSRGFPASPASITWDEYRSFDESRAVTWGTAITELGLQRRTGVPLGYDQRYIWQAVPQQGVTAGVTSVDVFQQTARTLPAGTAVVRNIDAVTAKPEVATTLNITNVPLRQVAAVVTNIPNVYLERDELATAVENDLRLSINEGLDSLVLTGVATSGFQAPGTDNILVSIRKAITTIRANGYSPNLLVLTPAADEQIDTMVSGISGGTADFVFGAGQFAPGTLFGLRRVVSKSVPVPVVMDTTANGRLYVSPISLARFEVDAGTTNRSNLRLEGHGAYGVERTGAAVRIAAS